MAYTVPGADGAAASPMRPSSPPGSPFVTFFHVRPPSVLRCRALPGPPLTSVQTCRRRCQLAARSSSGFFGSGITTSVTPVSSSTFKDFVHDLPPSVVLYSPRSPPGPHSGPWAAT